MRQQSFEKRIRKIRARYRKRIAIVAIVMLIIGIVLGIVADRMLFNKQDKYAIGVRSDAAPTLTPEPEPTDAPVEVEEGEEPEDASDEPAATAKATEAPAEDEKPQAEAAENGDYTIAMEAPTEEATAEPTPEPTPEPTATPIPGPTTIAVVPFGESYDFSTQIKADGSARISPKEDEAFETIDFTLTMKEYMLPSDFATKWGNVYKLQGTEAGAGFELTLHDYDGEATIVPQNIIKIVFQSESGDTENPGFQLMDAEIAGQTEVSLKPNVPKTLWKRYTFSNAGEEMKYLAVSAYNDGVAQTILFELKSNVAPTPDPLEQYTTLSRGTKSDAVLDMQQKLIDLGYLSGSADGSYGEKTQNAVRAAQKDFGMEENGTATPEFQYRLFTEAEDAAGDDAASESAESAEEETDSE